MKTYFIFIYKKDGIVKCLTAEESHNNHDKQRNTINLKRPLRVDDVLVDDDKNRNRDQDVQQENNHHIPRPGHLQMRFDSRKAGLPGLRHNEEKTRATTPLPYRQKYLFYQ